MLASASPRRRELLGEAGFRFEVHVADVDETAHAGESAADLVQRLALAKATAVAAQHPESWVLGGDTVVLRDTEILGKPENREAAHAMLSSLGNREHEVLSGVAWVHAASGRSAHGLARSGVRMQSLSEAELNAYLDGEEWRGKAGGYAIQGDASAFMQIQSGALDTVIGLPVQLVRQLLARLNLVETES